MAQLAEALREAGYVPTNERLLSYAVEVLGTYPNPGSTAAQEALYAKVVREADLLCELLAPFRSEAMARYLRWAVLKIEEQAPEKGRKPQPAKAQVIVELQNAAKERERKKQEARENERRQREKEEQYRGVLAAWLATKARDDTIDGKPFWDVSVSRAYQVLRHDRHKTRFHELLLAGLPDNDDRPIGFYRRPEEINEMWDRAHEA